jgi:hypothetical protein
MSTGVLHMPFPTRSSADRAAADLAAAYPDYFEAGPSSRHGGSWVPSLYALQVLDGVPFKPASADLSSFPVLYPQRVQLRRAPGEFYATEFEIIPGHDLPAPKPCRYCASTNVEVVRAEDDYNARCRPCGLQGPAGDDGLDAIRLWNDARPSRAPASAHARAPSRVRAHTPAPRARARGNSAVTRQFVTLLR